MKFAAIQLDTIAMEVNHNVHKALHWTRRAFEAGATHVFLHEGLTADYSPDPIRYGRSLHSHEVYGFSQLARRYNGIVALGLNEVFEGRPYITCVYLSGAGIEGVYRKSYLWPHTPPESEWIHHQTGYRMERGIIAPGDGTKNIRVGELLIGTLICADGGDPQGRAWETFRREVPDMIFWQSNCGGLRGNRARCQEIARELAIPVVATNRCGFSYHHWQTGGSFMVADDGEIVALANTDGEEEVIYADWTALTPRCGARATASKATVG